MSYQFESSSPPSLSSSISSLFTDQTQAKTKKEDYDYSILNIIPNLISEKRKKTIFVEKLVENQHSIVKLQEIMKSMDEFESLAQRSCQNDSSSGKYQNRKSTRITAN
ncbi:16298_t:CDS:2 [Entrophospora sp. SA101]|nr:16298_t:CDS:2 [Entrophospora sp. SA101]